MKKLLLSSALLWATPGMSNNVVSEISYEVPMISIWKLNCSVNRQFAGYVTYFSEVATLELEAPLQQTIAEHTQLTSNPISWSLDDIIRLPGTNGNENPGLCKKVANLKNSALGESSLLHTIDREELTAQIDIKVIEVSWNQDILVEKVKVTLPEGIILESSATKEK